MKLVFGLFLALFALNTTNALRCSSCFSLFETNCADDDFEASKFMPVNCFKQVTSCVKMTSVGE